MGFRHLKSGKCRDLSPCFTYKTHAAFSPDALSHPESRLKLTQIVFALSLPCLGSISGASEPVICASQPQFDGRSSVS
jgi:hypothetical protein